MKLEKCYELDGKRKKTKFAENENILVDCPPKQHEDVLRLFQSGFIDILVVVEVLSRSHDDPLISSVVQHRFYENSYASKFQKSGRAQRIISKEYIAKVYPEINVTQVNKSTQARQDTFELVLDSEHSMWSGMEVDLTLDGQANPLIGTIKWVGEKIICVQLNEKTCQGKINKVRSTRGKILEDWLQSLNNRRITQKMSIFELSINFSNVHYTQFETEEMTNTRLLKKAIEITSKENTEVTIACGGISGSGNICKKQKKPRAEPAAEPTSPVAGTTLAQPEFISKPIACRLNCGKRYPHKTGEARHYREYHLKQPRTCRREIHVLPEDSATSSNESAKQHPRLSDDSIEKEPNTLKRHKVVIIEDEDTPSSSKDHKPRQSPRCSDDIEALLDDGDIYDDVVNDHKPKQRSRFSDDIQTLLDDGDITIEQANMLAGM